MVKTIISILISFAIIMGISFYEINQVNTIFGLFRESLISLYNKSEAENATYEDGEAIRYYWNIKKKSLHIWIPHTSIENVDYQLNEAIGYLYEKQYEDVIPKIEVLIEMSKKIPDSYSFSIENIL